MERVGYGVITANSGREALDIYERRGSSIDLVILDLIMPGMGGKQCLEELLKIDPEVKVIIASGFAAAGDAKAFLDSVARGRVSKPFSMKKLLHCVRRALDQD